MSMISFKGDTNASAHPRDGKGSFLTPCIVQHDKIEADNCGAWPLLRLLFTA